MEPLKMILTLQTDEARNALKSLGIDVDDLTKKLKTYDLWAAKGIRDATKAARAQAETAKNTKKMMDMMAAGFGSGSGINIAAFTNKFYALNKAFELLGDAIKYNVNTAKEFELAMANLGSITSKTSGGKYTKQDAADLEFLKDKAIELGSVTTQTATLVANAFTIVGQKSPLLLDSAYALSEVTKLAITLSLAAGIDVPEAASALTNVMNQFEMSAGQAHAVIDLLASGSKKGAGDINYLSTALVLCGSVAHTNKVPIEQVIAALEVLAQGGIKPGQAGRLLKNVILNLETKNSIEKLKPSVNGLTGAFAELAKQDMGTDKMKQLFGAENINAALLLQNHVILLNKLTREFGNTAGAAADMSKKRVDTFLGSMVMLRSAWEGVNLEINKSNGVLTQMVKIATAGLLQVMNLLAAINRNNKYNELGHMKPGEWQKSFSGMTPKQTETFKSETERILNITDPKKYNAEIDKLIKEHNKNLLAANAELKKSAKTPKSAKTDPATTKVAVAKGLGSAIGAGLGNNFLLGVAMSKTNGAVAKLLTKDNYDILGEKRATALGEANTIKALRKLKVPVVTLQDYFPKNDLTGGGTDTTKTEKNEYEKLLDISNELKTNKESIALQDKLYQENVLSKITDDEERKTAENEHLLKVAELYRDAIKSAYSSMLNLDWTKVMSINPMGATSIYSSISTQNVLAENELKAYEEKKKIREKDIAEIKKYVAKIDEEESRSKFYGGTNTLIKWKELLESYELPTNLKMTDTSIYDLILKNDSISPERKEEILNGIRDFIKDVTKDVQDELYNLNLLDWDSMYKSVIETGDPAILEFYLKLAAHLQEVNALYDAYSKVTKAAATATETLKKTNKQMQKTSLNTDYAIDSLGSMADAFGAFSEQSKEAAAASVIFSTAASIAQIIKSFSDSINNDKTIKSNIWAWIAAGAAGTAALVSMCAQISAIGFAEGGIVGGAGNRTIGDTYLSRLNAGEMVLTKRQLTRLFGVLDGQYGAGRAESSVGSAQVVVKGSDLYLALNNYSKVKPSGVKFH